MNIHRPYLKTNIRRVIGYREIFLKLFIDLSAYTSSNFIL